MEKTVNLARAHVIVAMSLLAGAVIVAGCATESRARLPFGGEVSEPGDFRRLSQAWLDTQTPCQSPVLAAKVLVRGTVAKRRVNRQLSFVADIGTGRVRLESLDTAPGRFTMLASYSLGNNPKDEAALLLPDREWVVRSSSREVAEVALGVPLSAVDVQSVLTGCPVTDGYQSFEEFDDGTLKQITRGNTLLEVFMRRDSATSTWKMFAMVGSAPDGRTRWRADPGRRFRGVLESVRLTSLDWNGQAGRLFDLTFLLDHTQTPASSAEMFTLPSPESENFPIDAVRLNLPVPLLAASPPPG
jgi:hypothetical protein